MAFLDAGVTWEKVGVSPEEAQFIATRQFNREQIAAIFGVPVHYLGETVESRVIAEQREIEFLNRTLQIWFTKFEQVVNAKLFPSLGRNSGKYRAQFDTSNFAKPSFGDLVKGLQMARYAGFVTSNEGRKKLGYQPYSAEQHSSNDPADKLWQPVNMQYVPESTEKMEPASNSGAGESKPQGQGGSDQTGGDGGAKPPRQTGQGGKRDQEIQRYFLLFAPLFEGALRAILKRDKPQEKDFRERFLPIFRTIACQFSFAPDADHGLMLLPEATEQFIGEYVGFLIHRSKQWMLADATRIAAEELKRALEVFREKCHVEETKDEDETEESEEVEQ